MHCFTLSKWRGVVDFLLEDIPLNAAGGLTDLEDFFPRDAAFADRRSVLAAVLLDVNGQSAAGELLEFGERIAAAVEEQLPVSSCMTTSGPAFSEEQVPRCILPSILRKSSACAW